MRRLWSDLGSIQREWNRWMNATMLQNSCVLPFSRNLLSVYSPTRIILVEFRVHLLWEKKLSLAVASTAETMTTGYDLSVPIALVEWEVWCWNHLRSSGLIFFPGKFPLPTTGKIHCHISNQLAWSCIMILDQDSWSSRRHGLENVPQKYLPDPILRNSGFPKLKNAVWSCRLCTHEWHYWGVIDTC